MEYYKCQCCERNIFYLKRYPRVELICAHCGYGLEIYPEGLRFLASCNPRLFTKPLHKFSALSISIIIDGAI